MLFFNISSPSHLKWCIIEKADSSGIRLIESAPALYNCIIRNNKTTTFGGGMYIANTLVGQVAISNCIFENNLASNSGNAFGGGVFILTGNIDFFKCQF